MECEIVDGGCFATVYKYCRTHSCEPKDCPQLVWVTNKVMPKRNALFGAPHGPCNHEWAINVDACKHCGLSGIEFLYGKK